MTPILLAFYAQVVFAATQPIPVILDTDIGDDIDDTWALMMVLGSPEMDLKLITTASDDTPTKTRLVAKMLERVGRTDIPIGTGVKTSDQKIHQSDWLGDYNLADYSGVVHEDGVGELIKTVLASPQPTTIIVIGPQTNIKTALEREPRIAEKARIVSMAGSVHIGYDGKEENQREYNVYKDAKAVQAVFAAPWSVTIAPLDICGTLRLAGDRYKRVAESQHARARVVIENYDAWSNRKHHPADASSILFDTAAVYLAFDQALCEVESVQLKVTDEGATLPDRGGRPVDCALRWKDRDAFEEMLVNRLIGDSPAKVQPESDPK